MPNPESRFFGFHPIDPAAKTAAVMDVFANVAGNYDLMNDLMSGGLHRLWKDRFVRRCDVQPGMRVLDVAGGTGDIALRLLRASDGAIDLVVSDINPAMLERGRAKLGDEGWLAEDRGQRSEVRGEVKRGGVPSPLRPSYAKASEGLEPVLRSLSASVAGGGLGRGGTKFKPQLTFSLANAEALPFPDRSFDLVTIAFGLRNVTRIDQALREFYRVLKPGGRLCVLEFSPGVAKPLKPFYQRYCLQLLPALGKYVARDEAAYRYLAESIQQFPLQGQLARRMESAGFTNVNWLNFSGGIAVMHEGWRV